MLDAPFAPAPSDRMELNNKISEKQQQIRQHEDTAGE